MDCLFPTQPSSTSCFPSPLRNSLPTLYIHPTLGLLSSQPSEGCLQQIQAPGAQAGWVPSMWWHRAKYRRPLEESCPADSATSQTESRYLCVTSSVLTIHKKIRTNCQRNNGAWTKCNRGLKEMAITHPGKTCSMGTAPPATLAEWHPYLT